MVCQRCIITVYQILTRLNIPYRKIALGEIELSRKLTADESKLLEADLNKTGFELIESRIHRTVEAIKRAILEYINLGMESQDLKLSSFIIKKIPNDYS